MNARIIPLTLLILTQACGPTDRPEPLTAYDDLVALFQAADLLRHPVLVEGVPDYTSATMATRYDSLRTLQAQYARVDTTGWNLGERNDYRLVGAHLAGQEFNHRVLKRWSRDPVYYGVLSWFNPSIEGTLSLRQLPMSQEQSTRFRERLEVLPAILEQAKGNLTEMKPDLVRLAIKRKQEEEDRIHGWMADLPEYHPELVEPVDRLLESMAGFREWLEGELPGLEGSSGIGIENYNWLLKNVYLMSYDWEDCVLLCERELERSLALLKMEEHRNRNLPPLPVAENVEDHVRIQMEGREHLFRFVRENDILPQPDYMEVGGPGGFDRSAGRNFFNQVTDRDPLPLHPHDMVGHSPDGMRQAEWGARTIPRGYDPYYISGVRAEALATGMEELLMHLGMLDDRPRSRELTYILRVFRAIRALADLMLHGNDHTLEEVMDYAMATVPYGWYERDTWLIWEEMDLYMRQPGYGMGYLVGAVQLEKLIADEALRLGEEFDIKTFMGDFLESGMVPMEMIGEEIGSDQ
jgi:hypothetical protein